MRETCVLENQNKKKSTYFAREAQHSVTLVSRPD